MLVTTMCEQGGALDLVHNQSEEEVHIHQTVLDALEALLDTSNIYHEHIAGYSQSEVRQVMEVMLPGVEVQESHVKAVMQQTNGHPVHVQQILYYLESLSAASEDFLSRPGLMSSNLKQLAASSVKDLITASFDRLRPSEQLTLKVCSVLGSTIQMQALLRTVPLGGGGDKGTRTKELLEDLSALVADNFLSRVPNQTDEWTWNSAVARDTVYGICPSNLRRNFHRALAEALEAGEDGSRNAASSQIAYHWSKSCAGVELVEMERTLRAIASWKEAAIEMDQQGQYLNALNFMSRSLNLCEEMLLKRFSDVTMMPSPALGTLDVAERYRFKAEVYYKIVRQDNDVRLSSAIPA